MEVIYKILRFVGAILAAWLFTFAVTIFMGSLEHILIYPLDSLVFSRKEWLIFCVSGIVGLGLFILLAWIVRRSVTMTIVPIFLFVLSWLGDLDAIRYVISLPNISGYQTTIAIVGLVVSLVCYVLCALAKIITILVKMESDEDV